ncbi:acyltransferase family protein [Pseudomonas gingeri]|uniref:acyltransferase family protein n=1 Tax=Pseudomonas gingeri TaxID=117681 RepID=UPI0015A4856E|nr:acyltransferase [Pseudomonas gingeri]NWE49438.1 DUF2514 family protein [Pseudomonas gingeri]
MWSDQVELQAKGVATASSFNRSEELHRQDAANQVGTDAREQSETVASDADSAGERLHVEAGKLAAGSGCAAGDPAVTERGSTFMVGGVAKFVRGIYFSDAFCRKMTQSITFLWGVVGMILPSRSYGDTDFITGMRALAVLAVLLIHAGGAGFRAFGEAGNNFVDFGKAGVYAFFVISGFSVAQSYVASTGFLNYLNKRFWRIVPLYYFWIFVTVTLSATAVYWQERFGVKIDFYNVLMHLSFLSVFDYRVTNSILGVEWSISIEFFWYLFVPLLVFLSRRKLLILVLIFFSAKVHIYAEKYGYKLPIPADDAALFVYWSPVPFLFSFCLGIAAYRARGLFSQSGRLGNLVFLVGTLLLVVYPFELDRMNNFFRSDFFFMSYLTFAMIVFGTSKSFLFRVVLTNRAVLFYGTISYGVYLCHMPIMTLLQKVFPEIAGSEFLYFIVVVLACSTVSLLTYYAIERPGGEFGKKFGALQVFAKQEASAN